MWAFSSLWVVGANLQRLQAIVLLIWVNHGARTTSAGDAQASRRYREVVALAHARWNTHDQLLAIPDFGTELRGCRIHYQRNIQDCLGVICSRQWLNGLDFTIKREVVSVAPQIVDGQMKMLSRQFKVGFESGKEVSCQPNGVPFRYEKGDSLALFHDRYFGPPYMQDCSFDIGEGLGHRAAGFRGTGDAKSRHFSIHIRFGFGDRRAASVEDQHDPGIRSAGGAQACYDQKASERKRRFGPIIDCEQITKVTRGVFGIRCGRGTLIKRR